MLTSSFYCLGSLPCLHFSARHGSRRSDRVVTSAGAIVFYTLRGDYRQSASSLYDVSILPVVVLSRIALDVCHRMPCLFMDLFECGILFQIHFAAWMSRVEQVKDKLCSCVGIY